jgi:putative multiple sugar transport system substrate-binding protein
VNKMRVVFVVVAGLLVMLGITSCAESPREIFTTGSRVGISLPTRASASWVLAGNTLNNSVAAAGFKPNLQFASATNAIHSQKKQISAMIAAKTPLIIVVAVNAGALGAELEAANSAGITIIALDRNLAPAGDNERSEANYYIGYDPYLVGQMQAHGLLAGLRSTKGVGPYNVELFSGGVDDASSRIRFNGAMSILTPHIAANTLVVRSGDTSFSETTTEGGLTQNVADRMSLLMATHYKTAQLDGVFTPTDSMASAVIAAVHGSRPITTGAEPEASTVHLLGNLPLHSTVYSSVIAEGAAAVSLLRQLSQGLKPLTTVEAKSGITAPFISLRPILVTNLNAGAAFADNASLSGVRLGP